MIKNDFQTPLPVAEYMCSMIPNDSFTILEPTAGEGNIVSFLNQYHVTTPIDFFQLKKRKFDCIVMNPPFSTKSAYGYPEGIEYHGMKLGYHILKECMNMSNHVIALMPWFTISDSDVRLRYLKDYGLKSLTALPRKTFQYARIQTVILELYKDWKQETIFKTFNF
jgi:type I restriction-modification system DNA methylase subunit